MPPVWLDKIFDFLIQIGVIGIVVGLTMYTAMGIGVVFDKDFALNIVIGGMILFGGSVAAGLIYITMDTLIRYLRRRFSKK